MKYMVKITCGFVLGAALLLALFGACSNSLSPTAPPADQIVKTGSFVTSDNNGDPEDYFPKVGYKLNEDDLEPVAFLQVSTTEENNQKTLVLTFPGDKGLDILKVKEGEGVERFTLLRDELKKFLSFHNLTRVTISGSGYAALPSPYREDDPAGIGYEVSARIPTADGVQIALDLSITTSSSKKIEMVIDAAKYFYNETNLVDTDRNGVPGEGGDPGKGYDNYYELIDVSGGQDYGTGSGTLGYAEYQPRAGFDLSPAWKFTGAPTLNIAATPEDDRCLEITYGDASDYHDTTDYRGKLGGLVSYQRFDRESMSFVDINPTPEVTRDTDSVAHYYRFKLPAGELKSEAIIRAVLHKPENLTTDVEVFGFKQRYYFDSSYHEYQTKGDVVADIFVLDNEGVYTAEHKAAKFIETGTNGSYAYSANDGNGIILVLKLDIPDNGTTGPIGDQGLKPIPTDRTVLNNYIKVGVTNKDSRTVYPRITNAALDYTPGWKTHKPPEDNAPDIFKLYLDPAVNIRDISYIQVFLGDGDGDTNHWGYQGDSFSPGLEEGFFGDKRSSNKLLVDGKLGFVNYVQGSGSISDIRKPGEPSTVVLEGLGGLWTGGGYGILVTANTITRYTSGSSLGSSSNMYNSATDTINYQSYTYIRTTGSLFVSTSNPARVIAAKIENGSFSSGYAGTREGIYPASYVIDISTSSGTITSDVFLPYGSNSAALSYFDGPNDNSINITVGYSSPVTYSRVF
jgi:hypothetical protein